MTPRYTSLRMPGPNVLDWFGSWLPGLAFVTMYGLAEGVVHILDLPEHADVVIDIVGVGVLYVAAYCGSTSIAKAARRIQQEGFNLKQQLLAGLDRRFNLLNETSSDGVLLLSADGICRYAGPSIRRLLGYEPEGLRGRSGFEFVHPDDREIAADRFSKALLQPGQPTYAEFRLLHMDGKWRWIGCTMRNLLAEPTVHAIVSTYQDITERRQAEENLRTSQEDLHVLARRLLSEEEESRAQIAQELQDELAQGLAALKLYSGDLASRLPADQGSLLATTRTISELADSAVHSLRRLGTSIHPRSLDLFGLAVTLKSHAAEIQRYTGIVCEFARGQEDFPLAAEAPAIVFRIFQEALSNVVRHAHATRVRIELSEAGGNLLLTVVDNGRGITEQELAKRPSLGLFAMRERAHLLGGQVSIVGQAGEGTTVRVQIPLGGKARR